MQLLHLPEGLNDDPLHNVDPGSGDGQLEDQIT